MAAYIERVDKFQFIGLADSALENGYKIAHERGCAHCHVRGACGVAVVSSSENRGVVANFSTMNKKLKKKNMEFVKKEEGGEKCVHDTYAWSPTCSRLLARRRLRSSEVMRIPCVITSLSVSTVVILKRSCRCRADDFFF